MVAILMTQRMAARGLVEAYREFRTSGCQTIDRKMRLITRD